MNVTEIYDELKKLNQDHKNMIIWQLLIEEEIKFEKIVDFYVKYLEHKQKQAQTKESIFASCLTCFIDNNIDSNNDFFHSQAYVLTKNHLSDKWLDKHLYKKTEEKIKKNEELLNEF